MGRIACLLALFLAWPAVARAQPGGPPRKPNIIYILADDLGPGDLGCYGQKKIKTPHLDKLAAGGLRFTQFYVGSPVCAPSRCCFMTGKHAGHAIVRNNTEMKPEGQQPLPEGTVTLVGLLRALGYATGCIGKWGLGPPGSTSDPLKIGFQFFYGYNCQRHAHNHYPTWVYRNDKKETLEGNTGGATGKQHTHDLFEAEALQFIKQHKNEPFFLFLPITIPHVALQVPDDSLNEYKGLWDDPPYKGGKGYIPHDHPRAAYAAMVTRMDRTVGRIVALLEELKLLDDTIIIFTSDNGPVGDLVGGSDAVFFQSALNLRGFKGSLFEGGVRVPCIIYWRSRIRGGRTSDLPCANYDMLPTLCQLAGAATPKDSDGISLAPTLLEKGKQEKHAFLYWEFAGYGGQQALRLDNWKAVRQNLHKGNTTLMLFDLANDPGETKDVAAQHPEILARIETILREQHEPSKLYPIKVLDKQ